MALGRIKSYIVNPFDLCIMLVAAFLVLSGFFRLYNQNIFMLFNKSEPATVSVIIPLDDNISGEDLAAGDCLTLENGEELGEIVELINVHEKRYSAVNRTLYYDYTDKITSVIVRVDTRVKQNNSRFYINNAFCITPGGEIALKIADDVIITGQIDEINTQ